MELEYVVEEVESDEDLEAVYAWCGLIGCGMQTKYLNLDLSKYMLNMRIF